MTGITITQELKDSNPNLFKDDNVGDIKILKEIPKSFFSLTYAFGQRTDGYQTLPTSIHEADGFYNAIRPVNGVDYDASTQRLGALFFSVDKFTYSIEDLLQSEIDDNITEQAKDDFKNNLDGVFAYAKTPDGTKEYAIKIGDDGKILTVLIP